jgi:hypothetical protein
MKHIDRRRRLLPASFVLVLAAFACGIPGVTPTRQAPEKKPTRLSGKNTPAETLPAKTATLPSLPPTGTRASEAPTDAPTPTASPTLSAWLLVTGTWSGCVDGPQPLIPYLAHPCSSPAGAFATLFLKPHCLIGEYCGNYVKGVFESEFILLKLKLIGIQGTVVWMRGEADAMFSWATTDVTIERAGANVRIEEKGAGQYIHVLPPGCDPVIKTETGIGCYEHVP